VAFLSGGGNPPQYEPEQIRSLHTDELEQRRMPPTPATYAIAALLIAAAIAWIVMIVLRMRG
jgi:hypothetical protein